ncbi:MAG: lytic transglycosylase domain-containing protein [Acidobacteriota bacterium]|nr:lytic transglycosylase domain-containing protein [Acidobacteriota bacterium]
MKGSLLILALTLGLASPAFAQIYSWRDADGKLVLSDRPREDRGGMSTYEVPGSSGVRATKPLAVKKSALYDSSINEHSQRMGVSADLVRAVIQVESAFNPSAVSTKGAMGLMQLMPATARELGVANPFEPDQNIRGGVTYLKRLLNRYNQNVELALAAYNAGMGNVEKYGDVPPFKETQNYVKKITGAAPSAPPSAIYKWMELVNGKPVARYSNKPPASGAYELVSRR